MTLIVGIKCKDAVVIGSDSAVTLGPVAGSTTNTISQTMPEKIDVIDKRVIVAFSGYVGMGQRFVNVVKSYWQERRKLDPKPSAIVDGKNIAIGAIDDFRTTSAFPPPGAPLVPQAGTPIFGALVAIPSANMANLIEFPGTLQPELKTKDQWYVSIGSGQPVADPLLGFMHQTFWGDSPPDLQNGIFAATMVLTLGCRMTPSGVLPPIQMAILERDKDRKLIARRIASEELRGHEENVESAMNYFREYKITADPNTTIP